jgi:hypothetical protein
VPFEPVTLIEPAFVSVTVSLSDCPAEMLLELAVIATVGTEAAARLANNGSRSNKGRNFCMAGRL